MAGRKPTKRKATKKKAAASSCGDKASNEEVMSTNEELQSTNEELETSKEELQSLNEELTTVNNQLADKVEELESKHADLENLLAATDVATICLDTDLAVRWFTPAIGQVIRVRDSDRGRPLGDFAHDFTDSDLVAAAARVLKKLTPIEDEATCEDGRTYLRRMTPLRSENHRIGGVVITFIDISERKRQENDMLAARDMAEKIIDTVRESMLVLDTNLRIVSANESFYRTFRVSRRATEGRLIYELGNNQWDIPELRELLENVLPENNSFNDFEVDHHFETIGRKVMLLNGRKIDHIQRILLCIHDITEHKTANEFIRLAVEASPVASVMVGSSGDIVLVNQKTENLFNYKRDELLGKTFKMLLPERLRDQFFGDQVPPMNATSRAPQIVDAGDLYGLRKDGSEFPIELSFCTVDSPGGPHSLIAVVDITHRKESERAVRESEKFLDNVLTASLNGIYIYDLDAGHNVFINPEYTELTGYALQDLNAMSGDEFFALFHPEDQALVAAHIEEVGAAADGAVCEIEYRFKRADGKWIWCFSRDAVFSRNPDGSVSRLIGSFLDITRRRQSEVAIRESEQRFRAMTDDLPLIVWLHDSEGRQEFVNKTFCEYFGVNREKMRSDHWKKLLHPEDLAYVREFRDCVRERRPFHAQVRVRRADGQWRWLESWGRPRYSPEGEYLGHVGGSADITERKQAEIERDNLNLTLERQVQQRTEMLKLLLEVTRIGNESRNIKDAMQAALERIAVYSGWQVGHAWSLADDGSGELVSNGIWYVGEDAELAIGRLEDFQRICAATRFAPGDVLVGANASSSESRWIDDIVRAPQWRRGDPAELGLHAVIAFPVTFSGELVAVLEFFSDKPTSRDKRFIEIMPAIGIQLGHVIERKRLERLAADAAEFEQRRIGRDIHDGVGQEMAGLRYIAQTHKEALAMQSSPDAQTAQKIVEWLERVQIELRQIVRQLVPVEIDELGLVAALRGLTEQTTQMHDLDCSFDCPETAVRITNSTLATHLYRIAQEAVRNAVQHAKASHVRIILSEDEGMLKLEVEDDGVGIMPDIQRQTGLGLRSMAYRASLIGAKIDYHPRDKGGTRVACTVFTGGDR